MQYFVLAADGKEYGPATVATLQQWVAESRLTPNHMLKDAATGQTIQAAHVPDLFPAQATAPPFAVPPVRPTGAVASTPHHNPANPYAPNPMGGYSQPRGTNWSQPPGQILMGGQRSYSGSGNSSALGSAILSCVLGLCLFFVLHGIGLITTSFALFRAIQHQAEGRDHGVAAIIICVVTLAIIGLGWFLRIGGVGV